VVENVYKIGRWGMNPLLSGFRQILSGCLVFTLGVSISTPLIYPNTADQIHSAGKTNFSIMDVENSALPPEIEAVMPALPMAGDPPEAYDDSLTVLEGGTATTLDGGASSVLTNDFEDDIYETLTASIDTPPANGNLTLNTEGTFSYTHYGTETTTDSFIYIASDGVLTDTATVNIDITPVNDPPVANNDSIAVLEGGFTTKLVSGATSVQANDIDPDSTLNITLSMDVSHGTLTLNPDGTFRYQHNGSESIIDYFNYNASDGEYTDTTEVSIVITPVNDAPVAEHDTYNTLKDTRLYVKAPGLLANDSDVEADPLFANLATDVSRGELTLNGNGSIAYDPPKDFIGTVQFTYQAFDGELLSNVVTATITVLEKDDEPPTISWMSPYIKEGEYADVVTQIFPLEVDVLDNVEVEVVNFKRWEPSLGENGDWIFLGSVSSAPFRLDLDTSTINLGFNQITAEAYDTSGNYAESYIFLRRWQGLIYLPAVSR